jgi:hypothetical protein
VRKGNRPKKNSELEIELAGKSLEISGFVKYWFGALAGANQKP